MSWKIGLTAAIAALALSACPGAQVKDSADGDLVVKMRRVDVVEASFQEMKLEVVATVENKTSKSVSLGGASATLEVLGKGKDREGDPEMVTSRDEVAAAALKTGSGASTDTPEGEAPVDGEPVEEEPMEEEPIEETPADDDGLIDSSVDASGIAGVSSSGRVAGGDTVAAFERGEVRVAMTLKLPEDVAVMERLVTWRRLAVKLSGEVTVDGKAVAVEGIRELVSPNLPIVVLKSAQVASEDNGAQGAAFFDIGLENPNPFPLRVDDFSYAVEVAGKELRAMEGARETVPPSSLTGFEENYQMTEETYGRDLRSIMQKNTVTYRIYGKTTVRGIERSFEFTGEMQFPR